MRIKAQTSNGATVMRDEVTTSQLADQFAKILKEALEPREWNEMRRLNAMDGYSVDCCASHEFLDANMVMDDAFNRVLGRAMDCGCRQDTAFWNEAWEIAKKRHLTEGK